MLKHNQLSSAQFLESEALRAISQKSEVAHVDTILRLGKLISLKLKAEHLDISLKKLCNLTFTGLL